MTQAMLLLNSGHASFSFPEVQNVKGGGQQRKEATQPTLQLFFDEKTNAGIKNDSV